MATIIPRPRKNGQISYLIRISDGYRTDGSRVRYSHTYKPVAGMTAGQIKKELQQQIVAFEERVDAGFAAEGNVKFQTFAEKFLAEYVEIHLKRKSRADYKQQLERAFPIIGHIRLKDLRTVHLNKLYAHLAEEGQNTHTGGKLAPQTIKSYHKSISAVLTKAVKWGIIPYNPAKNAELPRSYKKEAPYLDENEAKQMLQFLHSEPLKYRAAITLCLFTGLRRGELLGLRWQDADLEAGTITVEQTAMYTSEHGNYIDSPKNSESARVVTLSKSTIQILQELLDFQTTLQSNQPDTDSKLTHSEARILSHENGNPIKPVTLTNWFKRFVRRNAPHLPNICLHSLRHTHATLLISGGIPLIVVSKRLGHTKTSTTSDIYAHVIKSAEAKAAEISEMLVDVV